MADFKAGLAALGARGPSDLDALYRRRAELATRQAQVNADLASGCNRAHSWREWSALREQLKGETQRLGAELATLKQQIREAQARESAHKAGKREACYRLLGRLADALDRVQDTGVRLTDAECDALDQAAEMLATAEGSAR